MLSFAISILWYIDCFDQSDQIERIFANWAIVFFGPFFKLKNQPTLTDNFFGENILKIITSVPRPTRFFVHLHRKVECKVEKKTKVQFFHSVIFPFDKDLSEPDICHWV
jgi:hypothetical protein